VHAAPARVIAAGPHDRPAARFANQPQRVAATRTASPSSPIPPRVARPS